MTSGSQYRNQKPGVGRVAPMATLLLLLGVLTVGGIDARALPGVDAYHERVRNAIDAIPYRVGPWVGVDMETPPAAVRLLKPNRIIQRQYRDTMTGRTFQLLAVHCADTRDMQGHYPPVCYPAHGWETERPAITTSFELGGQRFPARSYKFYRVLQGTEQQMAVFNFFVLPDGQIVADMETLRRVASRRAASQLGAAQFQLVGGETLSEAERRELIEEFIRAIQPAIRTVAEGVEHDQ